MEVLGFQKYQNGSEMHPKRVFSSPNASGTKKIIGLKAGLAISTSVPTSAHIGFQFFYRKSHSLFTSDFSHRHQILPHLFTSDFSHRDCFLPHREFLDFPSTSAHRDIGSHRRCFTSAHRHIGFDIGSHRHVCLKSFKTLKSCFLMNLKSLKNQDF